MRATLFLIMLCSYFMFIQAQTVPNGSFENWSFVTNSLVLPGWNVNNGALPDIRVEPDTQFVCLDSLSMNLHAGGVAFTSFPIDSAIKSLSFCLSVNIDTPDTARFLVMTYANGVRIDSLPGLINADLGPLFQVELGLSETVALDSVYVIFYGGNKPGTDVWVDQLEIDTTIVNSTTPPVAMEDEFIVYPNPATNKLVVKYPNSMDIQQIKVFDLAGRQVYSILAPYNSILNISSLQPGTYFIQASSNRGKLYTHRFVKQ